MMMARAAAAYKRVDLESAPKTEIVNRLFDRCVRDICDAKAAVSRGDVHAKGAAIDHAIRIIAEFQASLDHDAAPELCANLASLYSYANERLIHASLMMDTKALEDAEQVMRGLGDSFRAAHAAGAGAP